MRVRLWLCVSCGLVAGGSATAEEVGLSFRWRSLDLSALDLGGGREAYAIETQISAAEEATGPLAGLRGRCLLSGERGPGPRHEVAGRCVLTDGGDGRMVLRIEERSETAVDLVEGQGDWEGVAGPSAGQRGRLSYTLVTFGLGRPGVVEGTGQSRWSGLDDRAAPAPEPPSMELRIAPAGTP